MHVNIITATLCGYNQPPKLWYNCEHDHPPLAFIIL